ncbi:MAG: hypothetical protein IPK83_03145 [Planctomycetes bacterium]|nr:hypothetical protein [Planctomycetota bacterium]
MIIGRWMTSSRLSDCKARTRKIKVLAGNGEAETAEARTGRTKIGATDDVEVAALQHAIAAGNRCFAEAKLLQGDFETHFKPVIDGHLGDHDLNHDLRRRGIELLDNAEHVGFFAWAG